MIRFVQRREPLEVAGVLARGAPAAALALKLRRRLPSPSVAAAHATADGEPVLIAFGPAAHLPWVHGATWLGREPDAPALLVPTLCAIAPHASLVLRALAPDDPSAPIAMVPSGERILAISLHAARAPGAAELDRWLAELAR